MTRILVTFALGLLIAAALTPALFSPVVKTPGAAATPSPDLPGRRTPVPSPITPWPSAQATSPFVFPTTPPEFSPTPMRACSSVFPLESVAAIQFGETTIPRLEASFGRSTRIGGRPIRLRFDEAGCTLWVTLGAQEAVEAELVDYGSLGLLLDHYGLPEAVGLSQGNLTLLFLDYTVLLYPEDGIIAIFDRQPEALTRSTPVTSLQIRPAFEVDAQITRLNLRPVEDWQPPLR